MIEFPVNFYKKLLRKPDLHKISWKDTPLAFNELPLDIQTALKLDVLFEVTATSSETDTTRRLHNIIAMAVSLAKNNSCSCSVEMKANQPTKDSSIGKLPKKPDCSIMIADFVFVLRSEEKISSNLGGAIEQLQKNVKPWSAALYGDMPSTLGIAAAGNIVKMFEINRSNYNEIGTYDLTIWQHRFEIIKLIIQVIFYAQTRVAKENWKFGRVRERIGNDNFPGTQVSINLSAPDAVIEKLYKFKKECTALSFQKSLRSFYLDCHDVVGLERMQEMKPYAPKILFVGTTPFGVTRKPCDVEECHIALMQLAETVHCMHVKNWLHCDIRWTNVIFDPLSRRWILIDPEFAFYLGKISKADKKDWTSYHRSLIHLREDTLTSSKPSYLVDYFLLGKMFMEVEFLETSFRKICSELCGSDVCLRKEAFLKLIPA